MINKLFSQVETNTPAFLDYPKGICEITRKAIDAYNTLTDQEFVNLYSCHKNVYAKRVARYGDPYMKSPLAKLGKILAKIV